MSEDCPSQLTGPLITCHLYELELLKLLFDLICFPDLVHPTIRAGMLSQTILSFHASNLNSWRLFRVTLEFHSVPKMSLDLKLFQLVVQRKFQGERKFLNTLSWISIVNLIDKLQKLLIQRSILKILALFAQYFLNSYRAFVYIATNNLFITGQAQV